MNPYYYPKDFEYKDVFCSTVHNPQDPNFLLHTNKSLVIALSNQLDIISNLSEGDAKNHLIVTTVNPILEEIDKRLSELS
ncbi:hypothetical protein [Paenibacillus taichungensis]